MTKIIRTDEKNPLTLSNRNNHDIAIFAPFSREIVSLYMETPIVIVIATHFCV